LSRTHEGQTDPNAAVRLFNYLAYSFHKSSLFLLNCEKVWTITYNLKY